MVFKMLGEINTFEDILEFCGFDFKQAQDLIKAFYKA